jgi:hypothetical protein
MLPTQLRRNEDEAQAIRAIAEGGEDGPVLMLNLNRYRPDAGFPGDGLYHQYITGLEQFLPVVGGRLLWRTPVFGQAVGEQRLDEILAAWYPSHQAFLDLAGAPGGEENYRLRGLCVEYAVIHRCPGDQYPLMP